MNKHLGLDPDTRDFYRAGLEMGERGGLGLGQVLLAPSHRPVNCSVVHLRPSQSFTSDSYLIETSYIVMLI